MAKIIKYSIINCFAKANNFFGLSRLSKTKAASFASCFIVVAITLVSLRKSDSEIRRYLCTSRKFYVSSSQGETYLTNMIDGLISAGTPASKRALTIEEECETIYPSGVSTARWTEYYADTENNGVYYEELAPVDVLRLEGYNPDLYNGEVDPLVLSPEPEGGYESQNVDNSVLGLFEPRFYEPVAETTRPGNTTAYAVVIECCPGQYESLMTGVSDPGEDIYEASAIVKQGVCNATETTAIERRNRRREEQMFNLDDANKKKISMAELTDIDAYAYAMDRDSYTMYAFVHPDAVNCENPDGTIYNRVSLLQEQGYHVDIVGQPITNVDLTVTQPYIAEHIDEDVGVRDTMALHAFNLEGHNGVVLMDYNTQLQKPIQDEVDDLMNDPNKQVKYVKDKDGGVSKNFMIIKPSNEKFQEYRRDFMSTPYDPRRGWNSEGYNNFPGNLGLKGYFSYRAAHDPSWQELDRCQYNNEIDEKCIREIDVHDCTVIKHSKSVCGEPRTCPYDHPLWSEEKKDACQKAHSNYFQQRYELEQKYFVKPKIQERIGRFKDQSFLGYCTGPGKSNYLSMTSRVIRKPDWQVVCPPMTCPGDAFLKPDCTCTFPDEDPCNACPEGTRCQRHPEPMCIDCNCGFCDSRGDSCCQYDGLNSCRLDNMECAMQANSFPAFMSTDNVCNGVETADTILPYGCGCKLSPTLPCSYNPMLQSQYDDKCYICTTQDLANGECPDCAECLKTCSSCKACTSCLDTSSPTFLNSISNCLDTMDASCRAQCNAVCKKNPDHSIFGGIEVMKKSPFGDGKVEFDVDEVLAKFGLSRACLYAVFPFLALIAGGMWLGNCMRR